MNPVATLSVTEAGLYLVTLQLACTVNVQPTSLDATGLPYATIAIGADFSHSFVLPTGPDEISFPVIICLPLEFAADDTTFDVTGDAAQMDSGTFHVDATVSLYKIGKLTDTDTPATNVRLKPGSKLNIYRQGDSR